MLTLLLTLCCGAPLLRCEQLDMPAAVATLTRRAQTLYPESRDGVIRLLDTARTAAPVEACAALTQARGVLSRVEGPRIFAADRADPLDIPGLKPCQEPAPMAARLRDVLQRAEPQLYPGARKQLKALLSEAAERTTPEPRRACALYDEVRGYLVEVLPQLLGKLR